MESANDPEALRARIAKACRVVGRMGLTRALRGHISARIPGTDRIFVKARGPAESGVRYTTDEQIVEVGLDGKPVAGMPEGLRGPSEVFIHTAIYRDRPEVNAVLHMHPPTVVLFTVVGKPLLPIYGGYDPYGLGLALEDIPTFDRSVLINTPELGQEFAKAMGGKRACLMRGHGITTAAESIEEAGLIALSLNELATMNFHAHMLGVPRPISGQDTEGLQPAMRRLTAPAKIPGQPASSTETEWRYYCRLADEGVSGE
ncbi:MAG TPA: class II aldolase/adducin family protein [Micropepsaceae bacterium]|nr:class II aldolase/adducin family protein [Micropepsaceae bacterium]